MRLIGTLFVAVIIVLSVEAGVIRPSGIFDIGSGVFSGAIEGGSKAVQDLKAVQ